MMSKYSCGCVCVYGRQQRKPVRNANVCVCSFAFFLYSAAHRGNVIAEKNAYTDAEVDLELRHRWLAAQPDTKQFFQDMAEKVRVEDQVRASVWYAFHRV